MYLSKILWIGFTNNWKINWLSTGEQMIFAQDMHFLEEDTYRPLLISALHKCGY